MGPPAADRGGETQGSVRGHSGSESCVPRARQPDWLGAIEDSGLRDVVVRIGGKLCVGSKELHGHVFPAAGKRHEIAY